MSGTPSVDSLLTLFKGLQREKTCLQAKLKETQDRKMLLRSQVRGMNIKHHQARVVCNYLLNYPQPQIEALIKS